MEQNQSLITEKNLVDNLYPPKERQVKATTLRRIHRRAVTLGQLIIAETPEGEARQSALQSLRTTVKSAMTGVVLGEGLAN